MPANDPGARIGGQRPAGKYPEPGQLPARIRVLAVQGIRHPHTSEPCPAVGLVLRLRLAQVRAQFVPAHLGEQRRSRAALLLRLTGVDVSRCPVCGDGRMQITAMVVHEAPPPNTS
jgi:hypothetical protein